MHKEIYNPCPSRPPQKAVFRNMRKGFHPSIQQTQEKRYAGLCAEHPGVTWSPMQGDEESAFPPSVNTVFVEWLCVA